MTPKLAAKTEQMAAKFLSENWTAAIRRPVALSHDNALDFKEGFKNATEILLPIIEKQREALEFCGKHFEDGPGMYIARQFEDRIKIARNALEATKELV